MVGLATRVALFVRKLMGYALLATGAGLSIAELGVTNYAVSDIRVIVFCVVAAGLLGLDFSITRFIHYLARSLPEDAEKTTDEQRNGS